MFWGTHEKQGLHSIQQPVLVIALVRFVTWVLDSLAGTF
jgi:hypothetical protein